MKNAGASFQESSRVFLVLALLLFLFAECSSAAGQAQPRIWVVAVGISKYPGLPGGQQLQFAEHDAQSFVTAMQSAGINPANIRLLLGHQATLAAIREAIGSWLAGSAGPQDTVVFFFSGHGYVEHRFDEAYLLAEDSTLQNVFATALPLADIRHIVEARIKATRVVILQDSVRKDLFDPDSDGPGLTEAYFKAAGDISTAKPNTSVIVASSPGEFSWEGRRWAEMGVFTKTLIDGMAGKADRNGDGLITDGELFRFLSDQVPAETSGKQHPWRRAVAAAEAVLIRSPGAGPRTPANATELAIVNRETTGPARIERPAASQPAPSAAGRASDGGLSNKAGASTATTSTKPLASSSVNKSAAAEGTGTQPVSRSSVANKPVAVPGTGENRSSGLESPPAPTPSTAMPVESKPISRPPASNSSSNQPSTVKPRTLPPAIATADNSGPSGGPAGPLSGIGTRETSPPPRPDVILPNPGSIGANPVPAASGPVGSLPVATLGPTPSPLLLQLEVALDQGSLVTPPGSSAWDFYQKLSAVDPSAKELPHLKSRLFDAMLLRSKAVVVGDVRTDNISSNVDDLKVAGQMLMRLHGLQPENQEINRLQKLSAAEALIALQFYDEAVKALEPVRTPPDGWVENALGLATAGQLSDYEAERHFRRAIELEPTWAAPHYNLALLYRTQRKEGALAELEQAARLDPSNPAIVTALGDECFEGKHWTDAAAAYRAALQIRPDDDALHTKLGHTLYSLGLRSDADKEYQKAKELADRRK